MTTDVKSLREHKGRPQYGSRLSKKWGDGPSYTGLLLAIRHAEEQVETALHTLALSTSRSHPACSPRLLQENRECVMSNYADELSAAWKELVEALRA